MFNWMKNNEQSVKDTSNVYDSVTTGLQNVYKQNLFPLENVYLFHDFHSPALDDPDFDARPMVMLVGKLFAMFISQIFIYILDMYISTGCSV